MLHENFVKNIVSLVKQRLQLRPGTSSGGREIFIRDCRSLEAMIDSNIAKLFGLSASELKTINEVFGDECLGELGSVLKSMSFLVTGTKSKLEGKKQLGLWK